MGSNASGNTIYTCPMHPEVQQDHPGNCPKCGMTLEPKTTEAGTNAEGSSELSNMTRRFWIGAALTLPSCDELELCLCHRQCPATAESKAVIQAHFPVVNRARKKRKLCSAQAQGR